MDDLPFISALGHFFFPKFPLTSLTKLRSKFLFSSSSYLKERKDQKNVRVYCNSLILKKLTEPNVAVFW